MKVPAASDTLLPDPAACAALCADLRHQLVAGLRQLVEELVPLPDGLAARARAVLDDLTPDFAEPALFALYARLRDAALTEDAAGFEAARGVFAGWRLSAVNAERLPRLRVLGQGAALPSFDRPEKLDLVRTALRDDVGLTSALGAPDPDLVQQEAPKLLRACELLAAAAPDWAAETFELAREIVLAVDTRPDSGARFAGGSVFDLFGAVMVNPASPGGVPGYLLTLVHESSHLRLFCHNLGDELLLNDGEARYRSPLRQQPRPMVGIYHAAWVSARMAAAGVRVLAAPETEELLSQEERSRLARRVEKARNAFVDALGVVRAHGLLTDLGRKIMDDAEAGLA